MELLDLIRLSPTDPWWVTATLLLGRVIALSVFLAWFVAMVRSALAEGGLVRRWPWRLDWYWTLTFCLLAIALNLLAGIVRIATVGHIRDLTPIGYAARALEIVAITNLACWAMLAFWRWKNPGPSVDTRAVFGTLAEAMPIVVADNHGIITFATPALDTLVGAAPDELTGQDLTTLMPERFVASHERGLARYLATGESRIIGRVVEVALKRRDGTEIPVHLALATAEVDGQPWFVGAMWQRPAPLEEG